jgi:hypothetical protein
MNINGLKTIFYELKYFLIGGRKNEDFMAMSKQNSNELQQLFSVSPLKLKNFLVSS